MRLVLPDLRAAAIALVSVALAACGGGGGGGGSVPAPNVVIPFAVSSFSGVAIDNPFLPLTPGTTYVYEGDTEDGFEHIEVAVTTNTKTILGVVCVEVRDQAFLDGELVEDTLDWFAQDDDGNVWYFGEDTKEYTNGVVSSIAGSWEAGVDGALPGIIMQARPVQGDAYRQEYRPTVAEDVALIKQLGTSAEVPAGRYSDVLVTNDRDLLDLNKDEDKYFAPGVGLVKLGGLVNGHREDVWLVSILAPK